MNHGGIWNLIPTPDMQIFNAGNARPTHALLSLLHLDHLGRQTDVATTQEIAALTGAVVMGCCNSEGHLNLILEPCSPIIESKTEALFVS